MMLRSDKHINRKVNVDKYGISTQNFRASHAHKCLRRPYWFWHHPLVIIIFENWFKGQKKGPPAIPYFVSRASRPYATSDSCSVGSTPKSRFLRRASRPYRRDFVFEIGSFSELFFRLLGSTQSSKTSFLFCRVHLDFKFSEEGKSTLRKFWFLFCRVHLVSRVFWRGQVDPTKL